MSASSSSSEMSQVRSGILIAVVVFAVFAAFAFLAPATYRTSALVVLDAPAGAADSLPEPLEAARRLSESILDRAMLERLSTERAGSSAPEARANAANSVRRSLEIDTSDARAFSISYKDTSAARAQRVCNELAKHAVERAPQVLIDRSAERALDAKRTEQTQQLALFLAQYPQVAADAPASSDKSPDKDPALSAFRAEKAVLERRILELESGIASDNPYVDPKESDLKLLRRRLSEIDSASTARSLALEAKPAASVLLPEVRAEWRRRLEAVTSSSLQAQTQTAPELVARVALPAPLRGSPIDPNRPLLLFFGVVFGTGLGAAFSLAARSAQRRRSTSNRPPQLTPRQDARASSLQSVPAPPALPSALGPQVPISPSPIIQPAPPIVPIPQRQISSNPPGPRNPAALADNAPQRVFAGEVEAARKRTSSNPPPGATAPRRFASTLVLPPADNPVLQRDADPVLASAAQAWDQQIRAHEVPGFAIVKPGSEPPPPVPAARLADTNGTGPEAAAAFETPTRSRPRNQMKVTQPLGSFMPDTDLFRNVAGAPATYPPPSAIPAGSLSPEPASRYSYVSSTPPATNDPNAPSAAAHAASAHSPSPSPAPPASPVRVHVSPGNWQPDPALQPSARSALCEEVYPYAVENCLVLAVIAVPESVSHKSRVAAELALGLAASGHPRILLLEGDLQRPWVQRSMRIDVPISGGFSQQMNARSHRVEVGSPWTVVGCSKSLHVLAEGMMRSPGLLLSKQFQECLRALRTYYDIIIIDGPSTALAIDAAALNAVVDGLVTVCPATGSANLAPTHALFDQKRFSALVTVP